jgi:hypothetical protein
MTKKRRAVNPWAQSDVVDYILDSYAGTEPNERGATRRVFLWADEDGEAWIGNTAAFAEHVAETFKFRLFTYDYANINRILIEVGERIKKKQQRSDAGGKAQLPMKPDQRRAK